MEASTRTRAAAGHGPGIQTNPSSADGDLRANARTLLHHRRAPSADPLRSCLRRTLLHPAMAPVTGHADCGIRSSCAQDAPRSLIRWRARRGRCPRCEHATIIKQSPAGNPRQASTVLGRVMSPDGPSVTQDARMLHEDSRRFPLLIRFLPSFAVELTCVARESRRSTGFTFCARFTVVARDLRTDGAWWRPRTAAAGYLPHIDASLGPHERSCRCTMSDNESRVAVTIKSMRTRSPQNIP